MFCKFSFFCWKTYRCLFAQLWICSYMFGLVFANSLFCFIFWNFWIYMYFLFDHSIAFSAAHNTFSFQSTFVPLFAISSLFFSFPFYNTMNYLCNILGFLLNIILLSHYFLDFVCNILYLIFSNTYLCICANTYIPL